VQWRIGNDETLSHLLPGIGQLLKYAAWKWLRKAGRRRPDIGIDIDIEVSIFRFILALGTSGVGRRFERSTAFLDGLDLVRDELVERYEAVWKRHL
jgi:hypothetical protein